MKDPLEVLIQPFVRGPQFAVDGIVALFRDALADPDAFQATLKATAIDAATKDIADMQQTIATLTDAVATAQADLDAVIKTK